MKETSDKEEQQEEIEQTKKSVDRGESGKGNEKDGEVTTEQNNEQESKGKEVTPGEGGEEKDIESSEAPDAASKKIGKEATGTEQGLDEEWKNKMEEAILKLRSTLKEKLVKLGIKPEGKSTQILIISVIHKIPLVWFKGVATEGGPGVPVTPLCLTQRRFG